jgi:hypothetical protein
MPAKAGIQGGLRWADEKEKMALCYSPGMQRDVEVRLGPGDRERLARGGCGRSGKGTRLTGSDPQPRSPPQPLLGEGGKWWYVASHAGFPHGIAGN